MTSPDEAAAFMAVAHTCMTPEQVAEHCIALARVVAMLDNGLAALHAACGLPYAGIEAEYPNAYGLVTLTEGGADG